MNLPKIWSKTRLWLALLLAGLAAWPLVALEWNYQSAKNDAAKAHYRPATVAITKIVGGPTLHGAYGSGGEMIYVYFVHVQTGMLAGKTLKNVSLTHDYGVGSTVPLWLDSYGDVSDTNAYPVTKSDIVTKSVIVAFFATSLFWGIICGLFVFLRKRLWKPAARTT